MVEIEFEVRVVEYNSPVVISSTDVVDGKRVVEGVFVNDSVVDSRVSVDTVALNVVVNGSMDVTVVLLCSVIAIVVVVVKGKLVTVVSMLVVLF